MLEYAANFERFKGTKSIENIVQWMNDCCKELHLKKADFNEFCADGASNAIGAVAEFEASSRTERSNSGDVTTCIAHQCQRSVGFASGTIDFATPANEALGDILKKSHEITVRVNRSGQRMSVLRHIQEVKGRDPLIVPLPANETRWDSLFKETRRNNQMMGDISDALKALLAEDGADYDLLSQEEKESGDISRLVYTEHDKIVMRQWESAAEPCHEFTLFTQDNSKNAIWYVWFEIQFLMQMCAYGVFQMYPGKSIIHGM